MMEFLKTKTEIINWLQKHGIKNFKIKSDHSVDVSGDVNLGDHGLTYLPLQFNRVSGDFSCSNNFLTSLKGAPKRVDGDFFCQYNHLTNLRFAPVYLGNSLGCWSNRLTSLEGSPNAINSLDCSDNLLTSLLGCPRLIKCDLYCEDNHLQSFDHCPEKIKGIVNFLNNPMLGNAQYITTFSEMKKIHDEITQIKKEQKMLQSVLDNASLPKPQTLKI